MSARLRTGHDHQRKTCLRDFSQSHLFACQTYPAHAAAGRGWFVRTRTPDLPNMLPLYDFKHPRSHPKRGEHESHDMIHHMTQSCSMDTGYVLTNRSQESGGACRDRTDDLKLAKLPLSQLS